MFLTALELEADEAPDRWVIAAPLVWDDAIFGRLVAPRGFRTDLASIPRCLRNLPFLDPDGRSRRPAAMHDALYSLGREHGKAFADGFLRAALRVEGANELTAAVFYAGVHLFGGPSWRSDGGTRTVQDFASAAAYSAWVRCGASV